MANFRWVCQKRMTIKRNGLYIEVMPGEEVPEASHWHNAGVWERQRYIRKVPCVASLESKGVSLAVGPIKARTQVAEEGIPSVGNASKKLIPEDEFSAQVSNWKRKKRNTE